MNGPGDVYIVNLEGEEVHHWPMPHQPGLYGYMLPNGNLFYGGRVKDETWDRFQSWKRPVAQSYGLEYEEGKHVQLIHNSLRWKQYPGFDTWG